MFQEVWKCQCHDLPAAVWDNFKGEEFFTCTTNGKVCRVWTNRASYTSTWRPMTDQERRAEKMEKLKLSAQFWKGFILGVVPAWILAVIVILIFR